MQQGKGTNINRNIRSPKVQLITDTGENLGIMATYEALRRANEAGMDLVEISSAKGVPVCKIMDYGKWKYEQSKKQKKNRQQSQGQITKEMKFRPNTGDNDLKYRAKQVDEFLKEGCKIRLVVRFRGREGEHIGDTGKALLERFLNMMQEEIIIEEGMKLDGRSVYIMIAPKKKNADNN
jgi:translation initiation factor IF-3